MKPDPVLAHIYVTKWHNLAAMSQTHTCIIQINFYLTKCIYWCKHGALGIKLSTTDDSDYQFVMKYASIIKIYSILPEKSIFQYQNTCTWHDGMQSTRKDTVSNSELPSRCRRGSSTQEQRHPPPLPLDATAPPTCGRRESGPGLRVITQDQEYPLRKLRKIRDTYFIFSYFNISHYINT